MEQLFLNSATIGIVISLIGFEIGLWLKKKFGYPILNPLLIAILFVMSIILIFRVDYETYNSSAKYLSYLLTPATVSLAIPLYQQLHILKENSIAILCGIFAGVLTSLMSVFAGAILFGLSHKEYVTMLPKSITTAIGIGISEELGGYISITVAVIIVTGVLGNIIAESLCKVLRITNPIAKGVAIGTSAHAIGTARAMEIGEIEGAMSSLSIVISGICTLAGASFFANFI